jgi:hypothetical protein
MTKDELLATVDSDDLYFPRPLPALACVAQYRTCYAGFCRLKASTWGLMSPRRTDKQRFSLL